MIDVLVTGAGGALGSVLMRVLSEERKSAYGMLTPHGPAPDVGKTLRADLLDPDSYRERISALAPRAIVHLAAVSLVSEVLRDPDRARAINVDGTVALLELSAQIGARFVYASTDLVFDGESAPYTENDATEPCSLYGRTKLEAECHVLTYRRGLVLRLPLLYGLPEVSRPPTFFQTLITSLKGGQPVNLFEDELRTPLWLDDAARACSKLASSAATGVLHVGGPETLSRLDMGRQVASELHCSHELLVPTRRAQLQAPEPRPRDVSLNSRRYAEQFAGPAGLSMALALPLALAQGPHRRLS
jgi:dTDP-4-dehydrorhamnose reductase